MIVFLHIRDVRCVDAYWLELGFSDGRRGIADLEAELVGPVFSQLLDPDLFRRVVVNAELGTIQWANGADFAPEFLYFLAFQNDPALIPKFKAWGHAAEGLATSHSIEAKDE